MEYGFSRRREIQRCRRCSATDLVVTAMGADLVCRNCGEVQQSRLIVESSESRTFEEEPDVNKEERNSGAADSVWDCSEFRGGSDADITAKLNKACAESRDRKDVVLEEVLRKAADISFALHLPTGITVSS